MTTTPHAATSAPRAGRHSQPPTPDRKRPKRVEDLSLLTPETAAALQSLQSLDDAIAFRSARLDQPCPGCAPPRRCADHASDQRLITQYQRSQAATLTQLIAGFDPDDVRDLITGSEGTPPTVIAVTLAMQARIRELTADGPVTATFDGRPVIFERDGRRLIEHPLAPRSAPPGPGQPSECTP